MSMAEEKQRPQDPFGDNRTTTLQREALFILAKHYPDGTKGNEIRKALEDHHDKSIDSGRFYPNIDRLVKRGMIDRQIRGVSGRSHKYSMTEECAEHLIDYLEWCEGIGLFDFKERFEQ